MKYITAEQQARTKIYDRFYGATELILHNDKVVHTLGKTALDLKSLLYVSYLPNIRHGTIQKSQADKKYFGLPVLLLSDTEAMVSNDMVHPYLSDLKIVRPLGDVFSPTYQFGLSQSTILNEGYGRPLTGAANNSKAQGMRPGTTARTEIRFDLGKDNMQNRFFMSTGPALLLRSSHIAVQDTVSQAAHFIHEGIHALDVYQDAPLYPTLRYGAATELRAYQAQCLTYRAFGRDDAYAGTIEAMRYTHSLRSSNPPFYADDDLVNWMIDFGCL